MGDGTCPEIPILVCIEPKEKQEEWLFTRPYESKWFSQSADIFKFLFDYSEKKKFITNKNNHLQSNYGV